MRFLLSEDGRVTFEPRYFSEGEPLTRSYTVPQALEEYLFSSRTGQAPNAEPDKVWKAFFEQLGVSGPKWAEFSRLPAIGKLRVTSTPEHLSSIDQIFEMLALYMIEVEMQIHAFRTADIERLRLAEGMSLESLTALRQKGKSRLVASATALAKSGEEAIVKAVQEVIYPTELVTDIQTGSNGTMRSAAHVMMPGNFTMRETGMILQVIPAVMQNGTMINLTLKPEWVTLEGWASSPAVIASGWTHRTRSYKQPVFGVTSFETQAAVKDGETILLGSCSTPDGAWVQAGFLTARFVDKQVMSKAHAKEEAVNKDEAVKKKMQNIVIPEVTFRPPATIIDAVRFFKEASVDYDDPELPETQRGVNFVLNLSANSEGWTEHGARVDLLAASAPLTNSAPVIPAMSARFITLYDVLKLVCDITGMKLVIRDGIVRIEPYGDPDEGLFTRFYRTPHSYGCIVCETNRSNAGLCTGNNNSQDWKPFFEQRGVKWPTGSSLSIKTLGPITLLRFTNTPENLEVFEQVLENFFPYPHMAEMDVSIHAFSAEDIELLSLSGKVSVEALMALRKKGKSRQVASATALTKSGGAAIVKAVREILYPSELRTDCGQEESTVLMPSSFAMREVGMTLQVMPELVTPDGSHIRLTVKPQWVTLDGWKTYPSTLGTGWARKTLPFRQPIFGLTSFETQTVVQKGETVLLGSSSTPDGKWVHVGFLTVK
jgi:Flp pilus assembly secretin CpaC